MDKQMLDHRLKWSIENILEDEWQKTLIECDGLIKKIKAYEVDRNIQKQVEGFARLCSRFGYISNRMRELDKLMCDLEEVSTF